MLVLSRQAGEQIQIGPDITITVVRIGPHAVRIGIDAPQHLDIARTELLKEDSEGVVSLPVKPSNTLLQESSND